MIHFTSPAGDYHTPGSAPGPTLGNEYGKPLPFTFLRSYVRRSVSVAATRCATRRSDGGATVRSPAVSVHHLGRSLFIPLPLSSRLTDDGRAGRGTPAPRRPTDRPTEYGRRNNYARPAAGNAQRTVYLPQWKLRNRAITLIYVQKL